MVLTAVAAAVVCYLGAAELRIGKETYWLGEGQRRKTLRGRNRWDFV